MEKTSTSAPSLYLDDETAWLEQTARLVAEGRWEDIDRENLIEYLNDMARRDRREVMSALTGFLANFLKWDFQPEARTTAVELIIRQQQRELIDILDSNTLRNHGADVLAKAYDRAVGRATIETGLPKTKFPVTCSYDLSTILDEQFPPRPDLCLLTSDL